MPTDGVRYMTEGKIMSMSKKNYEAFAEAISLARSAHLLSDSIEFQAGVTAVVNHISAVFQADNPGFDSVRFLMACWKVEDDPICSSCKGVGEACQCLMVGAGSLIIDGEVI
jgi:hypothetical protein